MGFDHKTLIAAGSNGGGPSGEDGSNRGSGTGVATKPRTVTMTPGSYKVLILNDDFTPMDFVIHVLQKFFHKSMAEATHIMLQVHKQGAGVAGVYTHEIAETKVYHTNQYSRRMNHPLKCTMDKA